MTNFFEDFRGIVERFPDRVAAEVCRRDGTEQITYRELADLATRAAGILAGLGVQPRDRCAILADNDIRWCAVYLGILRLGAIAVPLDTTYRASQVETVLADCQARLIIASPRYLEASREAAAAVSPAADVVLLSGSAAGVRGLDAALAADHPVDLPPCPSQASDPAIILYTSGTTSDPKGVVLSHGNLLAEKTAAFKAVHVDEHTVVLGVLPLFHALAQLANLLLPFAAGARVVYLETVNSAEIMRALHERGINALAVVPQFFYLLHQRIVERVAASGRLARLAFRALLTGSTFIRAHARLNVGRLLFKSAHDALGGHMSLLISGGSRFDPAIGRDLYGMGFNIHQAYGLTECSAAATITRPGDPHVDTVGPPLDGVEIQILRDAAASGEREHPDGEVLIRGPIVMSGYYNRPDVNAQVLAGGWLHTGDLGYLDRGGRLVITGRKKEIIVLASGKNIYPEEIEAHYARSPFIRELGVLGVALPGEPSAERLHAIVVPDLEVMRERHIVNFREVIRFEIEGLSLTLPHHKRVLSFDVWTEDLPRTTTRKLKRHEIERRYREQQARAEQPPDLAEWSEADQIWAAEPRVSRILGMVRESARRHGAAVAPDSSLELDLGLDSMERVELLSRIEHEMGVHVPEEAAHNVLTVRDLVAAVNPLAGPGTEPATIVTDPWARVLDPAEPDPELAGILKPKPVFGLFAFLLMRTLNLAARAFLGLRVSGRQHLPADGPFLISPNHQSYLDAFLLVGSLPRRVFRRLFFVGASEYFQTPFRRRMASLMKVVPVDPDANLVRAMRAGVVGLRHDLVLTLFPEGERSPDGSPRRFKKGAAITALRTRVPIVPVAIHGAFEIWPRGSGFRWGSLLPWKRTRCAIRFGPPIEAETAEAAGADPYEHLTARLREAVVGMWEELDQRQAAQ